MKVVHIAVQHLPRDSRIYCKECISLSAGHDVHLLIRDGELPQNNPREPVHFHGAMPYPSYHGSLLGWMFRYVKCQWVNFRRAMRLQADLYHFHETPLIPLALVLRLCGKRVIYDVHEDAPRQALSIGKNIGRPVLGWIYSWVCLLYETLAKLLFSGFVIATPQIAQRFPKRRRIVVQNFALSSEIEELASKAEATPYSMRPPKVVYLGGLFRIRGTVEMIEAMGELPPNSDARLCLAGKFDPPKLRQECEALDGWNRVDYLGYLDRKGVIETLSSARIGLVTIHPTPQYRESWPIKMFEYMAAGLPIIASDFPLWRDVFGPHECIRFVDPMQPSEIANAIEFLLDNEEEALEMGCRGQRAALEHFNWDYEATKLVEFYKRFVSKKATG